MSSTIKPYRVFDDIRANDERLYGAGGKLLWAATLGSMATYMVYYHGGATDRRAIDSYNAEVVALTNRQFGKLGEVPQDRATLVKFYNDEKWVRFGESIFKSNCQSCHGADGAGLVGPNLTDDRWKNVQKMDDIIRVINEGAGNNAMPAWKEKLDPRKVTIVAAYVAWLLGKKPANAKSPDGANVITSWERDIAEVPESDRMFPAVK